MDKALIIFVRHPELGKVKTRLAAQIGNARALQIYIKLLQHTQSVANESDCDKYVFATEALNENSWNTFHKEHQAQGDLGKKMFHAFEVLFDKGYEKVVIIGSDCPGLLSTHIDSAFTRLDLHDVVIGPAADGGYYLLGMKNNHSQLFDDKRWSTDSVFKDTVQTINDLKLSFHQLEILTDVDEEKDIPHNWMNEISAMISPY